MKHIDNAHLVQMVVFELNEKEYGIPVTATKEVIKLAEFVTIPNAPEFIAGVINLRGSIICVVDLRKQFGFPAELSEDNRVMIVRTHGMLVGMIVDQVREVLKVPLENIDPVPGILNLQIPNNCLVGIAKIKKRIISLLNIENTLSMEQLEELKYTGD